MESFFIVSDGFIFSKHKTKEEALTERELNKVDGFTGMNNLKSRWYIKKICGKSSIYGELK